MEGLSHYIEFSKSSPRTVVHHPTLHSSICLIKHLLWLSVNGSGWELRPLFRGLLHINAAKKVAAVYLMRWWQLFPKIFLYHYHLRTCLKSILIVGVSWKIVQVTRMLAWLIFIRSEESNLLGPQPSTLSLHDYLFWDLPSHLLLFGRIPISQ